MTSTHLLYLSGDQLCAYLWQGGRISGGACFGTDHAGIDAFQHYLDQHGKLPTCLVADLIEEDFQRLQLPHVRGGAGRKLVQRRLLQQYRETPFRHHEVQGREPQGRRDDIVLLSALTNPGAVLPWAEALEALQIPLAGLYSTTLLYELLAARLDLREDHLLLVAQHSAGWRQSYFQSGQLKFSRLTPAIDRDGRPVDIGVETAKTQQFLTSVRLMARGNVLDTVVIAPADQLAALAERCEDGAETAFSFLPLDQVAARAGLRTAPGAVAEVAGRMAEPMLLALLVRQRFPARLASQVEAYLPSHYTLGPLQRYFHMWRLRRGLYLGAVALAAVSVLVLGANLWQWSGAERERARLQGEARADDQRYNALMAALPPRVTSTANLRAAVQVERWLATQGPAPRDLVGMLSRALDQAPQVRLLHLDWKVELPGAGVAPEAGAGQSQTAPIPSLLAGIPVRPPQALLLEAEILAGQGDYRDAVNSMNLFAQQLAANPRLTVQLVRPPLDTRSSVRLSAKAGAEAVETRASFALNLVWQP